MKEPFDYWYDMAGCRLMPEQLAPKEAMKAGWTAAMRHRAEPQADSRRAKPGERQHDAGPRQPFKSLIYLATPYSHPDPAVREARFQAVNRAAAKLMGMGLHVYSPISHTHPIALAGALPLEWEYWQRYDRAVLACCYKMIVLQLDGWNKSEGIQGEFAIAREMGLEIEFMPPLETV